MKLDTQFKVRFYGYCKDDWRDGKKVRRWEGSDEVVAVAYDKVSQAMNSTLNNLIKVNPKIL